MIMTKKKASALILVLVVMIIAGLGTTAILQAMISYSNMKVIGKDRIKAFYWTQAGMEYGIWQCRNGNFTSPVTLSDPNIPSGWTVVITKTQNPAGSGNYDIQVKVNYPGA